MRLLLTLLSFCLLSQSLYAQKKLKFDVDRNSGDTTFSTKEQRLYVKAGRNAVGEILKSTVYKSPNGYMLSLFIQTGRTNVFTVSAGSAVDFTLQDGTKLSLSCLGDHSSRSNVSDYGSFMYAYYRLTSKAISQLKSSPVSFIRVHASMGNMDYEIKDKQSDIILEQLGLF